MRLGVLTTSYPRNETDSAGLFVAQFDRWLADQGHQIDVIAPSGAVSRHPSITLHPVKLSRGQRLFYRGGVPEALFGGDRSKWGRIAAASEIPPFVLRQWRQYRRLRRNWDGLICHWLLPAALLTAGYRRRQVVIAHGSDVHLLSRLPASHLLLHQMAGNGSRLVLTHEGLRDILSTYCRTHASRDWVESATVIPMGIEPFVAPDPDRIEAHRRWCGQQAWGRPGETTASGTRKILLFMGRLVPIKGVDVLLQALRSEPEACLVVLGQGPQQAQLEAQARRLGVAVHFAGECHGEKKRLWLAAADTFVHPALQLPDGRADSAPVSVMEAMSAGLPVVVTAVGGLPQIVDHGQDGLLVRPNDPGALQGALRQLRQRPNEAARLGRHAAQSAQRFHWQKTGAQILNLLAEAWRLSK